MQIFAAIMTLMLYVMAYNQVLVQKIMRRERDYVRLAIALFTDLPPVIVHFAQLIAKYHLWLLRGNSHSILEEEADKLLVMKLVLSCEI